MTAILGSQSQLKNMLQNYCGCRTWIHSFSLVSVTDESRRWAGKQNCLFFLYVTSIVNLILRNALMLLSSFNLYYNVYRMSVICYKMCTYWSVYCKRESFSQSVSSAVPYNCFLHFLWNWLEFQVALLDSLVRLQFNVLWPCSIRMIQIGCL
jgi:hypothetical protein